MSTIYTAAPGGGGDGGRLEMGLVAPGQQPAPFVQSGGCVLADPCIVGRVANC